MIRFLNFIKFNAEEHNMIIKIVDEDPAWIKVRERYDSEIQDLRTKIRSLETELSEERTKAIRRNQRKFVKEHRSH